MPLQGTAEVKSKKVFDFMYSGIQIKQTLMQEKGYSLGEHKLFL